MKISDFGVVRDLASSNSIAKTFTGTLIILFPFKLLLSTTVRDDIFFPSSQAHSAI